MGDLKACKGAGCGVQGAGGGGTPPMTPWEAMIELAKLGMEEKNAKRRFAFDMAARQGEIAEKVMGNLMKLADVLSFGSRDKIVDAEFPGDDEPRHPRACAHFTAVDEALAQLPPEARKNMLACLRVDGEGMVASLIELFFADLEAAKAPPIPGSPCEPLSPSAFRPSPSSPTPIRGV